MAMAYAGGKGTVGSAGYDSDAASGVAEAGKNKWYPATI